MKKTKTRAVKIRTKYRWEKYTDDQLLSLRLCDLGIDTLQPRVQRWVDRVYREVARKDLQITPHHWLSDEWFSPVRVPGVAIPFYLAHPRLEQLEKAQMLEVEGGTQQTCLRILRHEMGHVVDHAWRLHRRRRRQELFGKSSDPYPETYSPRPYSKSYVLHLDSWYAQSHPDEDFAETFAVWLTPNFPWRRRYQGWKALGKLNYMSELMEELAGKEAYVQPDEEVDSISTLEKTLGEHYQEKRERYAIDYPRFYDRDLRRLFNGDREDKTLIPACTFIRRHRSTIGSKVGRWTGVYRYAIKLVVDDMASRCRELGLRLNGSDEQALADFTVLLTVQTMNFVQEGRHHFSL